MRTQIAVAQEPTFVRISIHDSKDFPKEPSELASELFTDIATQDNRLLFECEGLIKTSGIDFMNCPLNVVFKLRVGRRLHTDSVTLWHVVLPLTLISKYLVQPPFEWETWLGLFPVSQRLDVYPADAMFNQSVHLIGKAEFPKLRLRFCYHNPVLKVQLEAKRESEEEDILRKAKETRSIGQKKFQELSQIMDQKLKRVARTEGGAATLPFPVTNAVPVPHGSASHAFESYAKGTLDEKVEVPCTMTKY